MTIDSLTRHKASRNAQLDPEDTMDGRLEGLRSLREPENAWGPALGDDSAFASAAPRLSLGLLLVQARCPGREWIRAARCGTYLGSWEAPHFSNTTRLA